MAGVALSPSGFRCPCRLLSGVVAMYRLALRFCFFMLSTAMVMAAEVPDQEAGKPSPPFPKPSISTMTGTDRFVQLMTKAGSAARPGASTSCGQAVNPSFEFLGPALDEAFWSDPVTAGRTLLLQGELMVAAGNVLIRQGQSLLQQSQSGSPASPKE